MVRVVRKILGITGIFTQDIENSSVVGAVASKDERLSVYQALYVYETSEIPGKNKTERRN